VHYYSYGYCNNTTAVEDNSNWMGILVPDNVLISRLSLPGTDDLGIYNFQRKPCIPRV